MKLKGKNAISLIVLVITILVLSILAATVIISLSNTNIISEASKTTFKSDMSSYKEAYEMYVASELAKNVEFDRNSLNLTYQDDEFSEIFGNVSDRYKEGLKVEDGKLVYETADDVEDEVLKQLGMSPKYISKTRSYVGYFADVDGDGEVDGVIFADKCIGGSATYADSTYTIDKYDVDKVKDYEISQESYSSRYFGTHPVLKATGNGAWRFYVMALHDEGSYTWYANANVGIYKSIEPWMDPINKKDFGYGWSNTSDIEGIWNWSGYGEKSEGDVWSITKLDDGWYLPSLGEWLVFVKTFVASGGQEDVRFYVGLNPPYWTSSLITELDHSYTGLVEDACYVSFYNSWSDAYSLNYSSVQGAMSVRLAKDF